MRATVVAQVVALRLRTNNTAAVVRPRLENRPSPFLSLSFAGETLGPRLTTSDCHCSLPRESLELRVVLTPPVLMPPPLLLLSPLQGIYDSPPEIVESPKMATPRAGVVAFVADYPDHWTITQQLKTIPISLEKLSYKLLSRILLITRGVVFSDFFLAIAVWISRSDYKFERN